jgi:hypothetical protein
LAIFGKSSKRCNIATIRKDKLKRDMYNIHNTIIVYFASSGVFYYFCTEATVKIIPYIDIAFSPWLFSIAFAIMSAFYCIRNTNKIDKLNNDMFGKIDIVKCDETQEICIGPIVIRFN